MRMKKGVITSTKMTGTVTVTVHSHAMHPIYKKRYRTSKKFLADTNGMELHEGDLVVIAECRPLSKNKHFKVTEIVQAAPLVDEIVEEQALEAALRRKKKTEEDSDLSSES